MHYVESGNGKPIVCIPGLTADYFLYRKNIPRLARHFKVYALDLLGTGLSDKPYRRHTLRFYKEQLIRFIEMKRLKSVVIIASSWGCSLAITVALTKKVKVSQLILIAPAVPMAKPLFILGRKHFREVLSDIHQGKRTIEWAKKYYQERLRILFGKSLPDRLFNHYFRILKIPEGRYALLSTYHDYNITDINKVSNLLQETLIIWGANDPLFPLEGINWLHQKIKRSTLKIIPNAAHVPNETSPRIVNRLIIEFINRNQ